MGSSAHKVSVVRFVAVLAGLILAGAAHGDLAVSPDNIPRDPGAVGLTISVSNTGGGSLSYSAEVTTGADFLHITGGATGVNSGSVTMDLDANSTTTERVAIVTVTMPGAAGSPKQVTITQATLGPSTLVVNPDNIPRDPGAAGLSFSVSNTGGGSLSYSAEVTTGADFLHITSGATGVNSGTVGVDIDANPTISARVAIVTVTMPGAVGSPKTVTFTQATLGPSTLVVSPDNIPRDAGAAGLSFSVSNTGGGPASYTAEVTTGADFLHITGGATGVNSGSVNVDIDANPTTSERVAIITVTMPGAVGSPKTVTFTQATLGPSTLVVNPDNIPRDSGAAGLSFSVSNTGGGPASYTAEVTTGADFLHITGGATGVNSGSVNVDIDANPTPTQRVAIVTVTMPGAVGSPKQVTFTQDANPNPVLSVTPDNQPVSAAAGDTSFAVSNTGGGTLSYTAEVTAGADFVHITSGGSGGNAGTIGVHVDANATLSQRVGTITITAPSATGSPKLVTVTQVGNSTPVLTVAPDNQPVNAADGDTSFTVSNTGGGTLSYTAAVTAGADFVHVTSGGTGGNSGTIGVHFDANATLSQRVGTITVTAPGATGSPKLVTVTQEANATPVLSVTPDNQPVNATAGDTSFTVSNTGGGTLSYTAVVTAGADFVHVTSGGSGGNSGTIGVHFDANATLSQRVGTITVTATGATGSPKQVTVTQAGAANHAPVAQSQHVTTAKITPVAITLAATDADNNPLTFSIVAQPSHGSLSGAAPNVTYTSANFTGSDSFTFKANDGHADSNVATVSITVTGAGCQSAPAAPQNLTAVQEQGVSGLIHLNWDASEGAATYNVFRRQADTQDTFVLIGTATTASFDDEDAPAGSNNDIPSGCFSRIADSAGCINPNSSAGCYNLLHSMGTSVEYRVTAVNDCGESPQSPSAFGSAFKALTQASVMGLTPDCLVFACVCVALVWMSRRYRRVRP